jgi:endogenous inhibitor of DNA gyrase (YacG/DUF329 family)
METIKQQENCALCGLTVEIEEFSLATPDGLQKFCCAGCLSIYQLLNDEQITPNDNNKTSLTTQS